MSVIFQRGPGWAARSGDTLTGVLSYRADSKKPAPRTWQRSQFDPSLAAWFDAAAEGDRVEVIAEVDGDGRVVQVRMAHPPVMVRPTSDPVRLEAVERFGGGVNPYTFIPTPPRTGLPPELGDGLPLPHGVIDPETQWSGWLTLRLVTRTPLLLPDPEAVTRDADEHPTYPVRMGTDGMPLLHGASVKGALRSAYETVTGSRYGVFRGHGRALAYRRPASGEDRPHVTPARVESDGHGGLGFRLCRQPPLPVPLYDPPPSPGQHGPRRKTRAIGAAADLIARPDGTLDWGQLHGREVWYTTRNAGRPGKTRTLVDQVALTSDEQPDGAAGRGWPSITGRSIEQKASERLFVPAGERPIPVEERHHVLWHAVLASYRDAAEHNSPGVDTAGNELDRSRHVVGDGDVPERLTEGDLVYLDMTDPSVQRGAPHGRHRPPAAPRTVTAIYPVMIGRLPYQSPPSELLDESLHPAADLGELSSADRLFGWAPPESRRGRRSSSGYRGRLRVESVRCRTADWLVDHRPGGVTLAPLSSPKPTQFRFYAASDQAGTPVPRAARKDEGYGGGLRGRKAYWYPNPAPDGYWVPGARLAGGRFQEWREPPEASRSQTSTHLGWVREGTEFAVRLFLDGVPGPELGHLLWLAAQEGCVLQLGAGKPFGFGAVQVSIDWPGTELRTGEALRGCWLDLLRPEPSTREQAEALADEFGELTASNPVLAAAVAAWRKVALGTAEPAHYPRTQPEPEAETYRWFVANERIENRQVSYGFALPHALEDDQRLPLLPPGGDNT